MIETAKLRQKLIDLAVFGWRELDSGSVVLPNGWTWTTLGELTELITSGSRSWAQYYVEGKTDSLFLRMGNLSRGSFDLRLDDLQYVSLPKNAEGTRTSVVAGDLLFSITAEIGMMGLIPDGFPIAYINQHTSLIRFKPEFRGRFFPYVLLSSFAREQYESNKHGLKSSFRLDQIAAIKIPLPPLAEQKAIVKRLEELLALEREIAADSTAVDDLVVNAKRKVLDLAVAGKLVPRQGDWESVQLGDVCDYGKCIGVDPDELDPESWVLDLEDIEKDTGRLLVRVSAKDRKSSSTKHAFKQGTLLYSKLRTYLNKVLIAPEDGCCTSEILPLVFDDRVVPSYARIVLMSPMFLDYTAKCCYGVKMPRLGTADGRKGPFPLPPLAEQKAIVAKVDELFSVLDAMKGSQK